MTTAALQCLIDEWKQLKAWLVTGRAREAGLRTQIAAELFNNVKQPNGTYPEGVSRAEIQTPHGTQGASLKSKVNRDILEELLIPTLAEAKLTPEEAKGLIRGKPELGLKAYKALPEDKRKVIDKMLVLKQGAIELEIE